jgi:hypothetical protein
MLAHFAELYLHSHALCSLFISLHIMITGNFLGIRHKKGRRESFGAEDEVDVL